VVTAKLSGKMRQNKIDLQVGDRVKLEVSPYDTSMGRNTFRINAARDNYALR
jgi:translation initiation factor IF-1